MFLLYGVKGLVKGVRVEGFGLGVVAYENYVYMASGSAF